MARPSRGFTVSNPISGPLPACPTTGNTGVTELSYFDVQIAITWSPDVVVGNLYFWMIPDGVTPVLLATLSDVNSGALQDVNPFDYGGDGDTLTFWASAEDIIGCPNFTTPHVDYLIP